MNLRKRISGLFNKSSAKPVPQTVWYKKSYAQYGEDLIIEHIFNQLKINHPFYVDIGANHPIILNNTYLFYEKGGQGIIIEPDPTLIDQLLSTRPRDITVNVGVRFDEQTEAEMFIMSSPVLNTFSEEEALKIAGYGSYAIKEKRVVALKSLKEILRESNVSQGIDLLSIDVEGLDFEILKHNNISEIRPKVICVETLEYAEDRTEKKLNSSIDYLQLNGYFLYADTYLNSILIDKQIWNER